MTKGTVIQVPARRAGVILPGTLAVGTAVIELASERTPHGGTHSRSFAARWSKGTAEGDALVEFRPASKTTTEIRVRLSRPKGALGVLWLRPALRRLGGLFEQGLKYEIETRTIEEADAFVVRRTTPGLVRARTA
jgi:hypothetical protein